MENEAVPANTGTFYFMTNSQGWVTALTDSTGNVIERYHYTPYGTVSFHNPDNTGKSSTRSDFSNPYLYGGYRFDPETGFYYCNARYYNPKQGRFISRDPLGTVDGLNLLEYCGSNPVNYVDPLGTVSSVADDTYLSDHVLPVFKRLFGDQGWKMYLAFKDAHWENSVYFQDISGDLKTGKTKWGFGKETFISIEEDVDAITQAMLLMQGLEDTFKYYWEEYAKKSGVKDNAMRDLAYTEYYERAVKENIAELQSKRKTIQDALMAGMSIVNEGADWTISFQEVTEGNYMALMGLMPGVPGTIRYITKKGDDVLAQLGKIAAGKRGNLRTNLAEVAFKESAQAHHIVPVELFTNPEVGGKLFKYGIDPNSAVNGIFLPTKAGVKGAGNLAIHSGAHPKYSQLVKDAFRNVNSKESALKAIDKFRNILENSDGKKLQ